jgi:hypothetical protein
LAFTSIFVLLNEQRFAISSLLIMFSLTGLLPSIHGLYFTAVLISIGFHYFETMNQSLTLQWISKAETPAFLGQAIAVKGAAAVLAYSMLWML